MSKHKGVEHHLKAAEHHENAAKHHREAARHHDTGDHIKAGHHAHVPHGHTTHAVEHADHAVKHHADEQSTELQPTTQKPCGAPADHLVSAWPATCIHR